MANPLHPQDWTQVYEGKTVIEELIQIAAESIGVTPADISGNSRQQKIARARQAIYLVAFEAGMNCYQIGRQMKRDRKTIVYGVDVAHEMRRRDPDFAKLVDALQRRAPIKRKALPRLLPEVREDMNEEVLHFSKMKRGSIMLAAAIQRALAA